MLCNSNVGFPIFDVDSWGESGGVGTGTTVGLVGGGGGAKSGVPNRLRVCRFCLLYTSPSPRD